MTTQELRESARLLTQSKSWRDMRMYLFAYAGTQGVDPTRACGRYDMLAYIERWGDMEDPQPRSEQ